MSTPARAWPPMGILRLVGGVGLASLAALLTASYLAFERGEPMTVGGLVGLMLTAPLPQAERDAILTAVRDWQARAQKARISHTDVRRTLCVAENPMPAALIALHVAEHRHLAASGFSAEERSAGHQTIRRFSRGLADGTIGAHKARELLRLLAIRAQRPYNSDRWRIRTSLGDSELRQGLKIMKAAADAAGIPAIETPADIAREIRRLLDAPLPSRGSGHFLPKKKSPQRTELSPPCRVQLCTHG